jgi:MYXO-CTERM domain-containing protein
MSARPYWASLVAALLLTASPAVSRADTLRLTYDDTQADPAETFDEDCLGDTPAEDCDTRAALIEGELTVLLSRLESDEDPETLALFQAALELESPLVQAMAVRYLSRADQQPDDFFSKVKTFFLGPDAPLAVSSSAVLQMSSDETDQRLAELFDEQRPSSRYDSQPVVDTDDLSQNQLLQACIQDARFNLASSFAAADQFQPVERVLAYDRLSQPLFEVTQDYPVTAFATDASLEEVKAFFTARFGEPLGPIAGTQQRQIELSQELVELQQAAASGDQRAIKRMQEIGDELEALQQSTSLELYFHLTAVHAENDLVWIDASDPSDAATQAVRAVTAGEDPLLGKTLIRYFNATASASSGSGGAGSGEGDGDGDGDGEAGASSEPNGAPGAGGAADGGVGASSDDGCGCSVPGAPRRASGLVALALLGLAALRRSRRSA